MGTGVGGIRYRVGRWRERVKGDTTGTRGHLWGGLESSAEGAPWTLWEGAYGMLLLMEDAEPEIITFLYSVKISSDGTGIDLFELLTKEVLWWPPKKLRIMLGQVTLWKLTAGPHCRGKLPLSSQNIERSNWCRLGAFTLYDLISLTWEFTLQVTKRETWTPTQSENYPPIICFVYKMW